MSSTKVCVFHFHCFFTRLILFAGSEEKHYTYTIITTDSNKQLKFLHDRMPVILENGSDAIRTWLDPKRSEWSKELQSLLRPYEGELECYPVSKDVGKVGNNSPDFIVPVASTENKNNIANFFANAKGAASGKAQTKEQSEIKNRSVQVEHEEGEKRVTVDAARTEDNAPVPVPASTAATTAARNSKRVHGDDANDKTDDAPASKAVKMDSGESWERVSHELAKRSLVHQSPEKSSSRKTRSASSNNTASKRSPGQAGAGSQKITKFFTK